MVYCFWLLYCSSCFYYILPGGETGWLASLGKVLLQVLLIWLFFSLVYHLAARWLGGAGKFADILGLMAYASFPLTIFTLLSLVLGLLFSFLLPGYEPSKSLLFSLVNLTGLLWGWMGFLAYAILRWGEGLSRNRALVVILVVLLIYSVGFFVPV